jgi:hypothetical protein
LTKDLAIIASDAPPHSGEQLLQLVKDKPQSVEE